MDFKILAKAIEKETELITGSLVDEDGNVCSLGALNRYFNTNNAQVNCGEYIRPIIIYKDDPKDVIETKEAQVKAIMDSGFYRAYTTRRSTNTQYDFGFPDEVFCLVSQKNDMSCRDGTLNDKKNRRNKMIEWAECMSRNGG